MQQSPSLDGLGILIVSEKMGADRMVILEAPSTGLLFHSSMPSGTESFSAKLPECRTLADRGLAFSGAAQRKPLSLCSERADNAHYHKRLSAL